MDSINFDNLDIQEKGIVVFDKEEFIAVREYEPKNISLRDKDKLLWGKSFYEQLNKDIKFKFKKPN